MTEHDRILDAFRNCITEPKCKDCPWTECEELDNRKLIIPADLALSVMRELVEQKPRVMTMDELSEKTDVYFESLVYDTICPALSAGSYDDGTVGLMTLEDELFYMDEADYGVQWRCWTSRPTDEQREATPWQNLAR